MKPWTGGRVLSLDPSSTAIGWALMESYPIELHSFSVLKVRGRKDTLDRLRWLTREVLELIDQTRPDKLVIEWSNGKQHGRLAGRSQGLATLGQGQGWLAGVIEATTGHEPQYVAPQSWKGNKRKDRMARQIADAYPDYAAWAKKDRGFDAADAIGLGDWWLRQRQLDRVLKGNAA